MDKKDAPIPPCLHALLPFTKAHLQAENEPRLVHSEQRFLKAVWDALVADDGMHLKFTVRPYIYRRTRRTTFPLRLTSMHYCKLHHKKRF
jgi:hypothetical protein